MLDPHGCCIGLAIRGSIVDRPRVDDQLTRRRYKLAPQRPAASQQANYLLGGADDPPANILVGRAALLLGG